MMQLTDARGSRKYVTPSERLALILAARDYPLAERTFFLTLLYGGCRISEALLLTAGQIDAGAGVVRFETLKRRRKGIFREVPLPPAALDALRARAQGAETDRLWPWARSTASLRVAGLMQSCAISGTRASAKGLRHGFAIACLDAGIPLNIVQKWMGHASMTTTAIYADASGKEERRLAERLWAAG